MNEHRNALALWWERAVERHGVHLRNWLYYTSLSGDHIVEQPIPVLTRHRGFLAAWQDTNPVCIVRVWVKGVDGQRRNDVSISREDGNMMTREALVEMIRQGPVRVRMNNGDEYDIPNSEMATVSDVQAYVLVREDGKLVGKLLSLMCICSAQNYEPAQQAQKT